MKINIFYGTVYGAAEYAAEQIADAINTDGNHESEVHGDPTLDSFNASDAVIVVTSTTGQGDIPDNLLPFFNELKDKMPLMNGKPFLVVALGDSSYGETYCGAGKQFQELLEELQGLPKNDIVKIDALETVNADEEAVPAAISFIESL